MKDKIFLSFALTLCLLLLSSCDSSNHPDTDDSVVPEVSIITSSVASSAVEDEAVANSVSTSTNEETSDIEEISDVEKTTDIEKTTNVQKISETVIGTEAESSHEPASLPAVPETEFTDPPEMPSDAVTTVPEITVQSQTSVLTVSSTTIAPQTTDKVTEAIITETSVATETPSAEKLDLKFDKDTFIETVLLDEANVKISAVSMEQKFSTVELVLLIENNTAIDLTFSSGSIMYSCNSVNGYMINGGYLNTTVLGGKKAYETVSYYADDLEDLGIFSIAEMELSFRITDAERKLYLLSTPKKLKTTLAEGYDISDNTYQNALQNPEFSKMQKMTVLSLSKDQYYSDGVMCGISYAFIRNWDNGTYVSAEFVNKSAEVVNFSIDHLYVNGIKVYNGLYGNYYISPGCRIVVNINVSGYFGANMMAAVGLDSYARVGFYLSLNASDGSTVKSSHIELDDSSAVYVTPDLYGDVVYNSNGIKLTYISVVPTENEYRDDLDLLLIVENNSGNEIRAAMKFGETSVNGFMVQPHNSLSVVPNGECAVLRSRFYEHELGPLDISSADDITTMEMTFVAQDSSFNELLTEKIIITK